MSVTEVQQATADVRLTLSWSPVFPLMEFVLIHQMHVQVFMLTTLQIRQLEISL